MFVAGIMVGPLLVSWRLARRTLAQLDVRYSLPASVGANEVLGVEVHVTNRRRRFPAWGLKLEDTLEKRKDAIGELRFRIPLFIPYLQAGETHDLAYQGRLAVRGRYQLGPLRITTRFPLGLIRATAVVGEPKFFFVFPELGRLTSAWHQIVHPSRIGAQTSQARRGFVEGEFHGLRDWRNGDSRRWTHWRTTAKRNALTVRLFERQRNQDVAILVSLFHHAALDDTMRAKIEASIRFAATVVAHHCHRGSSRITLGLASTECEIIGGLSSTGLLQSAMERLAVVQPSAVDLMPELLERVLRELPRDTRIVVVSATEVSVTDTERFEKVWRDPRQRSTLSRVTCLTVGSPEFQACFDESGDEERVRA